MHNWLPDAHSEAPPPVSALLSAALLPGRAPDRVARRARARPGGRRPASPRRVFLAFGLASLAVAVPFLWRPLAVEAAARLLEPRAHGRDRARHRLRHAARDSPASCSTSPGTRSRKRSASTPRCRCCATSPTPRSRPPRGRRTRRTPGTATAIGVSLGIAQRAAALAAVLQRAPDPARRHRRRPARGRARSPRSLLGARLPRARARADRRAPRRRAAKHRWRAGRTVRLAERLDRRDRRRAARAVGQRLPARRLAAPSDADAGHRMSSHARRSSGSSRPLASSASRRASGARRASAHAQTAGASAGCSPAPASGGRCSVKRSSARGGLEHVLSAPVPSGAIDTLVDLIPAAAWDEREAHDSTACASIGHEPMRPLLDHAAPPDAWTCPRAGHDTHEVAVGPIHAGVIESGHFRFHVVGERILHLDLRLFYKHRGLEAAADGPPARRRRWPTPSARAPHAPSTNTVAYAQACEQALGLAPDRELARVAHAAARARACLQPPQRHLRDLRRSRLRRRHDGIRRAQGTRPAPQRAPHRPPLPVRHGARRRQRARRSTTETVARAARASCASFAPSTRAPGASSSSPPRCRHASTASASSPAMTPTASARSGRRPAPPASPRRAQRKPATCGTTASSPHAPDARPATSPPPRSPARGRTRPVLRDARRAARRRAHARA